VNKNVLLIVALAALLAVSGGIYAYTYTTGVGVINIATPTGDIATVNTSASQPDWLDVLTIAQATETLHPDGAGDETGIATQYPTSGAHWEKVDEASSDGDSTYVATNDWNWEEDLYSTADHVEGVGNVTAITIYMVARCIDTPAQTSAYTHIETGGTEYNGTEETLATVYGTFSEEWTNNPSTNTTWTWSEVDALQIGVGLRRARWTGSPAGRYSRCTQVYASIDYDYLPLTGSVPTGDLFEVYENPGYSGDLTVRVYLANTGDLQKAYESLDMHLYLEDSEEAGQSPNYQTLTLDNGVASFTLKDPVSDNHTLSVTGGTYVLVSDDTADWEAGWTVAPEFYCEATQR
jgi:hypothetical protein